MKKEVKVPVYLFLFYLVYGLISFLEIGEFVPPVFLMPFLVLIVGFYFIAIDFNSSYNWYYIFFSLGITSNANPLIFQELHWVVLFLYIGSILFFVFKKLRILRLKKESILFAAFPLCLLFSFLLFIDDVRIQCLYFLILLIVSMISFKRTNSSVKELNYYLLAGFTAALYLVNFFPYIIDSIKFF